eukprot:scaffold935_cov248-Pinguiococcus_pyrenoidosus.AAC.19
MHEDSCKSVILLLPSIHLFDMISIQTANAVCEPFMRCGVIGEICIFHPERSTAPRDAGTCSGDLKICRRTTTEGSRSASVDR